MSNQLDGTDSQSSASIFVTGLFAGAVIGAGLGLLLAPSAGSKLRERLRESATDVGKRDVYEG